METGQGDEAVVLARHLRPDIVVLDIRLDRSNGIEVARTLRRDLAEIKVLVLTAYHYEAYVRALFAIGVNGYLLKKASDTELIAAVRAVCRGETVLSTEIQQMMIKPSRSGMVFAGTLSEREQDVLTLVGQGDSTKEIARTLQLGERTVESYLGNAMAKLGARSRTDAIKLAIQRGVIVVEPQ
jgi:DNA-binding NarL/FixJ family response regulator